MLGADNNDRLWKIVDNQKNFLAYGSYNPNSKIAARIWSFDENENVFSHEFFDKRIEKALNLRAAMGFKCCARAGFRLINSEGDFLPGVIADFYDDMVVVQFLCEAADYYKEIISNIILQKTGAIGVYERSDADVRALEKLPPSAGLLAGQLPERELIIDENGAKFHIDIIKGHKSGFYLDQAASRKIIRDFSADKTVLNCFSYTGGFGVAALLGGAKTVVNVDIDINELNKNDIVQVSNDYGTFEKKRTILNPDKFKVVGQNGNIYELMNLNTEETIYKPRYQIKK